MCKHVATLQACPKRGCGYIFPKNPNARTICVGQRWDDGVWTCGGKYSCDGKYFCNCMFFKDPKPFCDGILAKEFATDVEFVECQQKKDGKECLGKVRVFNYDYLSCEDRRKKTDSRNESSKA